MTTKPAVIAIVGPTGSGKTALSIELATRLGTEIIGCDSRTVYKYMDIGTAKPTPQEQKGITHHLMDVVEPDQVFTVAQFRKQAGAVIDKLHSESKVPIVCGGTGLYARALLEGLAIPEVPPQPELRQELQTLAEEQGNQILRKELERLDPASLEKIKENDRFRMIRAIEVSRVLGKPFSQAAQRVEVPYNVLWIGLNFEDRSVLRRRIEIRLQEQLDSGLVEESKKLYEKYGKTQPLLNAVTYKEMINYFEGGCTLEEAVADCVTHNYQLARKQLMWFRANPAVNWFAVDKCDDLTQSAWRLVEQVVQQ
ncbi:MAG: tRNA (adenosine(37)-N6)-dimethylallyltransferase MiaA [Cyanobacteria bacterium]|nr:tRNA (adenosine(37)-N6)-dimethylallyltransferase MiaA [Cyanobacteriota bacterium]